MYVLLKRISFISTKDSLSIGKSPIKKRFKNKLINAKKIKKIRLKGRKMNKRYKKKIIIINVIFFKSTKTSVEVMKLKSNNKINKN
jgi:hypothetical protein